MVIGKLEKVSGDTNCTDKWNIDHNFGISLSINQEVILGHIVSKTSITQWYYVEIVSSW